MSTLGSGKELDEQHFMHYDIHVVWVEYTSSSIPSDTVYAHYTVTRLHIYQHTVYIYLYTFVIVYIYLYTFVIVYIYLYTFVTVYIYLYTFVTVYIYLYTFVIVYIYLYTFVNHFVTNNACKAPQKPAYFT